MDFDRITQCGDRFKRVTGQGASAGKLCQQFRLLAVRVNNAHPIIGIDADCDMHCVSLV